MKYTGFHRVVEITRRELKFSWPIAFCNEICTESLDNLRARYRSLGLAPPSFTALIVKAIAMGIREVSRDFPELNATMIGIPGWRVIHYFDRISAGVAVSYADDTGQDRGAQCVMEDPEKQSLSSMTRKLQEFASKDAQCMRDCESLYHKPRPIQEIMLWCGRTFPELRRRHRGTFTLTSVGKFGVDFQLSLPQAACLSFGFGAIRQRPVVRNEQVVAARCFYLTLSFERRLMNGKPCSLLMERIRDILHHCEFDDVPESEVLKGGSDAEVTCAMKPVQ